MKRIVSLLLIVCLLLTAAFTLTGCAKRGECDGCGDTAKLEKFVDPGGETHWFCENCMKLAQGLMALFG